ncbi:hypothetical protein Efla_001324 [Eimeria flavescens]
MSCDVPPFAAQLQPRDCGFRQQTGTMDIVDKIWSELKNAGTPCGIRLPLQLSKEKKVNASQKAKVFAMQHAFQTLSVLKPPRPHADGSPAGQAGGQPQVSPRANLKARSEAYSVQNWQAFASTVQRHANILKEDSSKSRRHENLLSLKQIFMRADLPHGSHSKAFPLLVEALLLCLSDPAEAARELATELLSRFFSEIAEVDEYLGPLLDALVQRFRSQDIEGVLHLPPVMRPEPEYKPLQLTPVEKSEDVRQRLLQLLHTALDRSADECVWSHLDKATGLLRAGAMDICPRIKSVALGAIVEFCDRHRQMLLHFTEPLARSLLSCLVCQHAKIRLSGLRALTHVLACGPYKYSAEIIQMLAGWRDPNYVPIASLYEATTTRNYFAELLADHSPLVRMFFFDSLAHWLLKFEDKADYESWLFPYLLSGLFDPFRPIQRLVYELLERLGKHYEVAHEKDLREIKQLGKLEPWSYDGKSGIRFPLGGGWQVEDNTQMNADREQFVSFVRSYSERLRTLGFEGCSLTEADEAKFVANGEAFTGNPPRPCLGARTMVRTYFRRYAKTLFEPVEDFKEVTMTTSARLMVVSFGFVEDSFVEWLDNCLRTCARTFSSAHLYSSEAKEAYQVVLRQVGIFIDPQAYWDLVKEHFNDTCTEDIHTRVVMLNMLAPMLQGSFSALHATSDMSLSLGRLTPVVPEVAEALARSDLLQEQYIDLAAESALKVLEVLVDGAFKQKATLPAVTRHHLLSVTGALAHSIMEIEDKMEFALDPQLQRFINKLLGCDNAETGGKVFAKTSFFPGLDVGLSAEFPPSNLAALSTFLHLSAPSRLLEGKAYEVVLNKLEEFSAATQKAVTRSRAVKTGLWLVRRLMLLDVDECDTVYDVAPMPPAAAEIDNSTAALGWSTSEEATGQEAPARAQCTLQKERHRKQPQEAAAEVLSSVVLSRLKNISRLADLKDTLAALEKFLVVLPPVARVKPKSVVSTLVTSGLVEVLSSFLRESRLHTKLFCLACEEYAHDSAGIYPDKSPAKILDDMPLGRRRELRLSAIKVAAQIRHDVILQLRLVLPIVAGHQNTLALIFGASAVSLLPPSKAQKRSGVFSPGAPDADGASSRPSTPRQPGTKDAVGQSGRQGASSAQHEMDGVRCQAELPLLAQSPWLIFQLGSCLIDAIVHGTAFSKDPAGMKSKTDVLNGWFNPLLTMPVMWDSVPSKHIELNAAQSLLSEISSESDLCQVVDSCVRHVVELDRVVPEETDEFPEGHSKDFWLSTEFHGDLQELLYKARMQINGVGLPRQREQAKLALSHLVRLTNKIYPQAVQGCLRQYETTGHFRRHAILTRIMQKQTDAKNTAA